ncbi:DUF2207 domain-containing protein [Amycolatopsis rhabdoformis]|uniref:DUF2207 domain-containing protein n=1 Tax=Amycolatopsis rhabdoformis TaxID=1448059 RepID=A0ABZ1I7R4_9PSEU|nr:DUF2207 domain-containing protein [Amycolatopsis rhabdoformis]WSE29554.1 DUF2207 domain-containing protein [Amycolatopsis rhabdoformis]
MPRVVKRMLAALGAIPLLLVLATPASAQDLPALPQSAEVTLKLQRDGSLSVTEAVSVPSGTTMTRTLGLRTSADAAHDRVLKVRDVSIEGSGSADFTGDQVVFDLRGGTSVVRYTVDGVVGQSLGVENATWDLAGGWDTRLELLRATFAAPNLPDAVTCLAGPPGSTTLCAAAQLDHSGLTRVSVSKLAPGDRVELTAELPAGTVPATEDLVPASSVAGAFLVTTPVLAAWLAFAVLLVAGLATLVLLRRRDRAAALPVRLDADGQFSSPQGVLPGHLGSLLTGRSDRLDVAATVLDLCVRNYLWVTEESDTAGWTLHRRNPPDEYLTAFERTVYETAVPGESARLSAIAPDIRDELRTAVVRRGWLSPWPARLAKLAGRLCGYGVFLTALLAFTVGYAQLGLVVVALGAALALFGQWLPARTASGSLLRDQVLGLRAELTQPAEVTDLTFSRALPYALALGETDRWLSALAAPDCSLQAYWLGAPATPARTGAFLAALGAATTKPRDLPGAVPPAGPRVRSSA